MDFSDLDSVAEKLSGFMDSESDFKVGSDFLESFLMMQRLSKVFSQDRGSVPPLALLDDLGFLFGEERVSRVKTMMRFCEIFRVISEGDCGGFRAEIALKKEALGLLVPFVSDECRRFCAVLLKCLEIREILEG